MNAKKRLIILLAAVLFVPQVWKFVRQLLWSSNETLQAEVNAARDTLDELSADLDSAMEARAFVRTGAAAYLPLETSVATTILQKWVYDRLQTAGLNQSSVTFGDPEPFEESTQLLTASLTGEAPLGGLVQFMGALLKSPSGLRCSELELSAEDASSDTLKFDLRIEGLGTEAGTATELPSVAGMMAQSPEAGASADPASKIFAFARPKVVVSEAPPPVPVEKPPAAPAPVVVPATPSQLVFVGTIVSAEREEAIFHNPTDGSTRTLQVGEEIVDNGFSARILAVSGTRVMLRMAAGLTEVQLSESLADIPAILWNPASALTPATPPSQHPG